MNRLAELEGAGTAVAVPPAAADSEALDGFYPLVADVQTHIREIQNLSQRISVAAADQMRNADMDSSKAAFQAIEEMMNTVNDHARQTKEKLQKMAEGTAKLKATPADEAANTAVIKIQQNQHAHLLRTFQQAMQDYQKVQDDNKAKYTEQAARRIRVKCTNADGSTIDEATAHQMAVEALVQGKENEIFQQSKDTLAQIIETRNDIYKIEQSMRQLNQLFTDLAVLVNEQGEVMDQIFSNVQRANTYMAKGREQLAGAKTSAKKSRTKMCWIIILVFVIFAFILASALGSGLKKP